MIELPGRLLLVRHAAAKRDRDVPRDRWPLSQAGADAAERLADQLARFEIRRVVSSPARRAIATVAPLVARLDCEFATDERLDERVFGHEGVWIDDFDAFVERAFNDRTHAENGAESVDACARRMQRAIAEIRDDATVVASHGQAIAAFLSTIDQSFSVADWRALRMPDVVAIENGVWRLLR